MHDEDRDLRVSFDDRPESSFADHWLLAESWIASDGTRRQWIMSVHTSKEEAIEKGRRLAAENDLPFREVTK